MMNKKGGVTFIEILIAVAIIAIVVAIVLPSFSSIKANQVLDNAVENVISSLNKARSQTLSSLNSSEYGVRFEQNQVIIFKGTVYVSSDPMNEVIGIIAPAVISDVTLGGVGGSSGELYFNRLSGNPSKSGVITISIPSKNKAVTISATGALTKN
jgi:prepilin-type N-terminal cleavage/methylation domain-containing protein